jgi:thiosulfate reductase/polysulfide reductase chain A
MKDSKCIVLIGSHIGENTHSAQVNEFAEAIRNGAGIITVDPRFSVAASKSKYWLPIRPGTDMALLLAWIHVIIEEELYDKDYVNKYATGFDELKEAVKNNTPEWAYPITSIKPGLIRETAG